MKNYLFLTISLLFLSISLCGQNKTYQGAYRMAWNITGNVTYEYKEVDFERVKDGKFLFNKTNDGNPNNYTISISGAYKNGEKNGHWKSVLNGGILGAYTIGPNSPSSNKEAFLRKGVITEMEGEYLRDKKDGKWTMTKTGKKFTNSAVRKENWGYSYNSTANFKNGKFYGDFIASEESEGYVYSLKGYFAEGGYPDSTWVVQWKDSKGIEYLMKLTFNKGQFVSIKTLDYSTGESISWINPEKYSWINDMYRGKSRYEAEYGQNIPSPIGRLISYWLWDETLTTEEIPQTRRESGNEDYMYLFWD